MRDSGLAERSIGHRCVALEQQQSRVRHLQAPGTAQDSSTGLLREPRGGEPFSRNAMRHVLSRYREA